MNNRLNCEIIFRHEIFRTSDVVLNE